MQSTDTRKVVSATFDGANLVSAAGLIALLGLVESAGLTELAQRHLSVPGD